MCTAVFKPNGAAKVQARRTFEKKESLRLPFFGAHQLTRMALKAATIVIHESPRSSLTGLCEHGQAQAICMLCQLQKSPRDHGQNGAVSHKHTHASSHSSPTSRTPEKRAATPPLTNGLKNGQKALDKVPSSLDVNGRRSPSPRANWNDKSPSPRAHGLDKSPSPLANGHGKSPSRANGLDKSPSPQANGLNHSKHPPAVENVIKKDRQDYGDDDGPPGLIAKAGISSPDRFKQSKSPTGAAPARSAAHSRDGSDSPRSGGGFSSAASSASTITSPELSPHDQPSSTRNSPEHQPNDTASSHKVNADRPFSSSSSSRTSSPPPLDKAATSSSILSSFSSSFSSPPPLLEAASAAASKPKSTGAKGFTSVLLSSLTTRALRPNLKGKKNQTPESATATQANGQPREPSSPAFPERTLEGQLSAATSPALPIPALPPLSVAASPVRPLRAAAHDSSRSQPGVRASPSSPAFPERTLEGQLSAATSPALPTRALPPLSVAASPVRPSRAVAHDSSRSQPGVGASFTSSRPTPISIGVGASFTSSRPTPISILPSPTMARRTIIPPHDPLQPSAASASAENRPLSDPGMKSSRHLEANTPTSDPGMKSSHRLGLGPNNMGESPSFPSRRTRQQPPSPAYTRINEVKALNTMSAIPNGQKPLHTAPPALAQSTPTPTSPIGFGWHQPLASTLNSSNIQHHPLASPLSSSNIHHPLASPLSSSNFQHRPSYPSLPNSPTTPSGNAYASFQHPPPLGLQSPTTPSGNPYASFQHPLGLQSPTTPSGNPYAIFQHPLGLQSPTPLGSPYAGFQNYQSLHTPPPLDLQSPTATNGDPYAGLQRRAADKEGSPDMQLWCAASQGQRAVVKELIDARANIDWVNDKQWVNRSVLMEAVFQDQLPTVTLLLENKANVDLQSKDGKTALHWAVCYGKLEVAEMLVLCDANLHVKSVDGYSALHWAGVHGEKEVMEMLLKYGADPFATDIQGKTSLDWAKQKKHNGCVDLLLAAMGGQPNDSKHSLDKRPSVIPLSPSANTRGVGGSTSSRKPNLTPLLVSPVVPDRRLQIVGPSEAANGGNGTSPDHFSNSLRSPPGRQVLKSPPHIGTLHPYSDPRHGKDVLSLEITDDADEQEKQALQANLRQLEQLDQQEHHMPAVAEEEDSATSDSENARQLDLHQRRLQEAFAQLKAAAAEEQSAQAAHKQTAGKQQPALPERMSIKKKPHSLMTTPLAEHDEEDDEDDDDDEDDQDAGEGDGPLQRSSLSSSHDHSLVSQDPSLVSASEERSLVSGSHPRSSLISNPGLDRQGSNSLILSDRGVEYVQESARRRSVKMHSVGRKEAELHMQKQQTKPNTLHTDQHMDRNDDDDDDDDDGNNHFDDEDDDEEEKANKNDVAQATAAGGEGKTQELPDKFWEMDARAKRYILQGTFDKAEPLLRVVLKGKETHLGQSHLETLHAAANMGVFLGTLNRPAEGEPFMNRALTGLETIYGQDHPKTLDHVHNLAQLYKSLGKYESAEPLLRRARAGYIQSVGEEHPDTLAATNNLAYLLKALGQLPEAEQLMTKVLKVKEERLGAKHMETMIALSELAGLQKAQGKFDDALPLMLRALALKEACLGPKHVSCLTTLNNLAQLYKNRGQLAEAEAHFAKAAVGFEEVLGAKHANTVQVKRSLARLIAKKRNRT
eukprot:g19189.t1